MEMEIIVIYFRETCVTVCPLVAGWLGLFLLLLLLLFLLLEYAY